MPQFQSAPLSVLRVGAVLGSPIYDPHDSRTKLLGAGVVINQDLLTRLRGRGVQKVILNQNDLAILSAFVPQGTATEAPLDHDYVLSLLENDESRELDRQVEAGELPNIAPEEPFAARLDDRKGEAFDQDAMTEIVEHNERNVSFVEGLFNEMVASRAESGAELDSICTQSLDAAKRDMDLFVCLGVNPYSTDYPSRHGMHVGNLAIAVGAAMDLGPEALRALAIGCLLHDVGMLQLPKELYSAKRRFSTKEVRQVAEHPVRTMEVLEAHRDKVPFLARVVAYQLHERCDGSGYPRGRGARHIHPLAKIAALADAFVGLAANRPHRPAVQPYHVMAKLLRGVKQGLFDPAAMRGLLRAVSVFPIGSFVETSDGRVGRVIRSNGDSYDRPVLEIWEKHRLKAAPRLVNLTNEPDLRVVRPLLKLAA